jgi:porin
LGIDSEIRRHRDSGFRQRLGSITARIGILNANNYFDSIGTASYLLNPSYGIFPIWSVNISGLSTYPFSSLGGMIAIGGDKNLLEFGDFGADAFSL